MFRIQYRATQGQVGQGSAGGGFLLDQPQFATGVILVGGLAATPFWVCPQVDTQDILVSSLLDAEPSAQTPKFQVGRATLSLIASQAASANQPGFQLLRQRGASTVTVAFWDGTALTWTAGQNQHKTGAALTNAALQSGDILLGQVLVNGAGASGNSGVLTVDIEA